MTFPLVVRVFFAIDLPPEIKEKLGSYIGQIKRKSKAHSIRWSKPENLHITLQFLAEVQSAHLPELIANVRKKLRTDLKHIMLEFGGVQLFPNPFRPRVLVLDVLPQSELKALSALIGEGIQAAQYPIEDRPFRAHLTIGRIKQPQGLDLKFLAEFTKAPVEAVEISEIVLFRSEPQPEGSHYTVLERIELVSACQA